MARISLTKSFPPTTTSVLNINETSRTGTQTTFSLNFATNLGSSISYTEAGYVATVTISGSGVTTQAKTYTLKESGSRWSGTATHTSNFNSTFNIPGSVSSINVLVSYKYSDEATTMSGSTSMSLTKMVSVLGNISLFNDESSVTIPITKYVGTYSHVLKLYARNSSDTIDTSRLYATRTGVEDGDTFQLNATELQNLYVDNTTTSGVNVIFELSTYDGNTLIGTSTTKSGILIINADPIFTSFTYSDINPTTIALTGDNSKIIKDYSTLEALISVANKATAQKGASMVSYSSNGVIENYSDNADVTLEIPNYSASDISVSAIDSRGKSTSITKAVDLINYEDIAITSTPTIERQSSTGEATTINIHGSFWNDSFGDVINGLNVTYKYRVSGSSGNYTDGTTVITPTISNNTFIINKAILGDTNTGFDSANSYEVVITIADELSSYEIAMTLQAGIPAFAVYGNKMSIGDKYDENLGGSQLWGDIYLNGTPAVYIVESGSNSDGSWIKYSDGTMICYATNVYTGINITSTWGSLYESGRIQLGNLPQTFISVPTITATCVGGSSVWLEALSPSTTSWGNTWFTRPVSASNATTTISFIAIGKWK